MRRRRRRLPAWMDGWMYLLYASFLAPPRVQLFVFAAHATTLIICGFLEWERDSGKQCSTIIYMVSRLRCWLYCRAFLLVCLRCVAVWAGMSRARPPGNTDRFPHSISLPCFTKNYWRLQLTGLKFYVRRDNSGLVTSNSRIYPFTRKVFLGHVLGAEIYLGLRSTNSDPRDLGLG
jgi:hypothetical protein